MKNRVLPISPGHVSGYLTTRLEGDRRLLETHFAVRADGSVLRSSEITGSTPNFGKSREGTLCSWEPIEGLPLEAEFIGYYPAEALHVGSDTPV